MKAPRNARMFCPCLHWSSPNLCKSLWVSTYVPEDCNKLHMILICIWWQHKVHLLLSILVLSVLHGIMKRNLRVLKSQGWNFGYIISFKSWVLIDMPNIWFQFPLGFMWQNLQAQSARLVEDFDLLLQKDIMFVSSFLCWI